MFENTIRALNQLENGMTYELKILPDKDGYVDKECPNTECLSRFKVSAEDWKNLFSDNAVYCPFCGHSAPARSWWTTEQVEQAKQQTKAQLVATINQAMSHDVNSFNRAQQRSKGFIKVTMKFSGKTSFIDLPASALEEMEQKITCDSCGAHYAVIGSAFYCPCCGKNSARLTFNNSIEKVRAKVKNLPLIRDAISVHSKDEAERTCKSLLESSLSDLVVAFQRVCECVYPQITGAKPLRKNVFQRLNDGNTLWMDLVGEGYANWITESQYAELNRCFQQRHLLQHQDGIVDQDYLDKSGDNTYQIGQRLIIKSQEVTGYTQIVEILGNHILGLLE